MTCWPIPQYSCALAPPGLWNSKWSLQLLLSHSNSLVAGLVCTLVLGVVVEAGQKSTLQSAGGRSVSDAPLTMDGWRHGGHEAYDIKAYDAT